MTLCTFQAMEVTIIGTRDTSFETPVSTSILWQPLNIWPIDAGLWWTTFYHLSSRGSRRDTSYPLTGFSSLKELTLVLHDRHCALEAYTPHRDHEVKFAEVSLDIFTRSSSYGRAIDYLVKLIAKYKSENPEWHPPKLHAVIAGLDERMCCMHKHLKA